uniref:Uncharacterized protein n=1 Tax=Hanusia phi TaxID=3032 RepID=A0A7S0EJ01_9CRYP|mmetsp:Transcript_24602/g.55566  ORF Transcript_24602/g.55566 Transcript_24602/m.55566 type:complete len:459 (+) Transcript_24602:2-1378(+)
MRVNAMCEQTSQSQSDPESKATRGLAYRIANNVFNHELECATRQILLSGNTMNSFIQNRAMFRLVCLKIGGKESKTCKFYPELQSYVYMQYLKMRYNFTLERKNASRKKAFFHLVEKNILGNSYFVQRERFLKGLPKLMEARSNEREVIKALLTIFDAADLTKANIGMQILHVSCKKGLIKVVEEILQTSIAGELLTKCDKDQNTCLHLAASAGHLQVLKVLVMHPSAMQSISKLNKEGKSVLSLALDANLESNKVVEFLLSHDNIFKLVNITGREADIIQSIFSPSEPDDKLFRTILHLDQNHIFCCRNASQQNILHLAVRHGCIAMVEDLLKRNACLARCKDLNGLTPLHWAIRKSNFELLELMIKNAGRFQTGTLRDDCICGNLSPCSQLSQLETAILIQEMKQMLKQAQDSFYSSEKSNMWGGTDICGFEELQTSNLSDEMMGLCDERLFHTFD